MGRTTNRRSRTTCSMPRASRRPGADTPPRTARGSNSDRRRGESVTRTQSHPALYWVVALLWLVGAVAFAATGQLAALAPPIPQLIVGALTLALILSGAVLPGFRV